MRALSELLFPNSGSYSQFLLGSGSPTGGCADYFRKKNEMVSITNHNFHGEIMVGYILTTGSILVEMRQVVFSGVEFG